MNGSRDGTHPVLALSTASVILAALHPFRMIFLPFSLQEFIYILMSSLAWIGFSVESFRSTVDCGDISVRVFLQCFSDSVYKIAAEVTLLYLLDRCVSCVMFFGTVTTFMFSFSSSRMTLSVLCALNASHISNAF